MKLAALALLCCALAPPAWPEGDAGHPVAMWRADGATNTVYVLGSIHLLRAEDHPLPRIIDVAYADAEVLVMELDMDDLDALSTQAAFNRAGVLRDGTTLRDLMGDERYVTAEETATQLDIPLDMLDSSEPWLAAITVELMILYRSGFDPRFGIEMTMTERATSDGKPIEGLESVDEQLSFLDGLSLDAQAEMLLQILEQGAGLRDSIDAMIDAWRHGDMAVLERELLESMEEQTELGDALIWNRNRRWADTIVTWLDDDRDYLVIVGALHLVGDGGVPALLDARGVDIRQLRESPELR
ncbi:MAG: TraB/GumN family protein [Gammaproteobacteria bacterium]|nr:TraB/GumN family protein [Gammaproteobacteria bacterium]MBT8104618.1 TraB/GumN family protein [Gammaproteobacteria bacterium]NNF49612.1 TraB/GumN family protein [Woeseiaceae bacterium]NNK24632.1 TraB/GumN family protein [Woeseiaceae bacterium]NNL63213.1 TraB/GumN family protein [Woeseiaceae bacterium]